MATIYHGTPMTPRAALEAVCPGRAMCVSFFRPDDVEAVERLCPFIMYDNGAFSFWQAALRSGKEWAEDRDWTPFLSVAGTSLVHARALGRHSRYAGGTFPAQRQPAERLAVWDSARGSAVAHGWAYRATGAAVRAVRPGCAGMDRSREKGACGLSCIPPAHGRGSSLDGQYLAPSAHDARDRRCLRLPLYQRGQHEPCAERMAL